MTPKQMAIALCECGECDTMAEAYAFLLDMGEIDEDQIPARYA